MPEVQAFTDGACRGNPGPGGWGVVLRAGSRERELCGGELTTTVLSGVKDVPSMKGCRMCWCACPVHESSSGRKHEKGAAIK